MVVGWVEMVAEAVASVDWKLYAGPLVALLVGLLVFLPTVARLRMDRRVETYKLFLEVSGRVHTDPGDADALVSLGEQVAALNLLSWLTRRYRWLRDPGRRQLDEQASWLAAGHARVAADLRRYVDLRAKVEKALRQTPRPPGLRSKVLADVAEVSSVEVEDGWEEFERVFDTLATAEARAYWLKCEAITARNRARGRRFTRSYERMRRDGRGEVATGSGRPRLRPLPADD